MDSSNRYQENTRILANLMDAGIDLMRQNIRRRHPGMAAEKVDILLGEWLRRSDDPIPGDVSGKVRVRERFV